MIDRLIDVADCRGMDNDESTPQVEGRSMLGALEGLRVGAAAPWEAPDGSDDEEDSTPSPGQTSPQKIPGTSVASKDHFYSESSTLIPSFLSVVR